MSSSDTGYRDWLRELWFSIVRIPEKHLIERFSPHGDARFVDPCGFGWTTLLESNWTAIRKELDDLLKQEEKIPNFQDVSKNISITDDDRWKTYFLYCYGNRIPENCARCPRTTELIEQVPGMQTAFFSILHPGKHIPEHRGPYKGVLRYHLGLQVPGDGDECRIRVGEEYATWEEGESLMFDDTHPHEVWNETDRCRVVLFMDVVRPLPEPLDTLNRLFLKLLSVSPPVQTAVENQKRWARQIPVGEGAEGKDHADPRTTTPARENDTASSV